MISARQGSSPRVPSPTPLALASSVRLPPSAGSWASTFAPAGAVRPLPWPLPLALSVRLPPSAGSWALTPPAPYVGVGLAPKSKL